MRKAMELLASYWAWIPRWATARGLVMRGAWTTSLLEKLSAVEALFAGATTAGERVAADEARKRIQLRLKEMEATDPPVEYKVPRSAPNTSTK